MVDQDSERPGPPGMPAWVKLLVIAVLVVVVATVLAMVLLGGDHGPGRHM